MDDPAQCLRWALAILIPLYTLASAVAWVLLDG